MTRTTKQTLRCMDCAYASETYPEIIDVCDLDMHMIRDADTEFCDKFQEVEL